MASVTVQVTIETVAAENEEQFFQNLKKLASPKELQDLRYEVWESAEVVKATYDEPDSGVEDNREEL